MAFSFVDIEGKRYVHNRDPGECPVCHIAVKADPGDWALLSTPGAPKGFLEILYKCPRRECGHMFIGRFRRSAITPLEHGGKTVIDPSRLGQFELYDVVPKTPTVPAIPAEVSNLSRSFVTVYQQSLAAEAHGLDQIAGMGYRKALEFLVKDYCILMNPNSAEQIKVAFLGNCIQNFIIDQNIQACAKRAAWLGNDETHYTRHWIEKDIDDLKILLTLTVNWIHNSLLTQKYVHEMP